MRFHTLLRLEYQRKNYTRSIEITTVNADTAYAAVKQEFSWGALLCALGLFLLFAAAGYLLRKFKKYKR